MVAPRSKKGDQSRQPDAVGPDRLHDRIPEMEGIKETCDHGPLHLLGTAATARTGQNPLAMEGGMVMTNNIDMTINGQMTEEILGKPGIITTETKGGVIVATTARTVLRHLRIADRHLRGNRRAPSRRRASAAETATTEKTENATLQTQPTATTLTNRKRDITDPEKRITSPIQDSKTNREVIMDATSMTL